MNNEKRPQATPALDDEAKLHNAAGQAWDSEKLDRINDEDAENVQLDQEIRKEAGELKGRRRRVGTGDQGDH